MDIYEQITRMADEIAPELVAQRRDFHKFAEKGWFEMRTSSIIARKLTELGYEVLVGDQVCKKDRSGVCKIYKGRYDRSDRHPALRRRPHRGHAL